MGIKAKWSLLMRRVELVGIGGAPRADECCVDEITRQHVFEALAAGTRSV